MIPRYFLVVVSAVLLVFSAPFVVFGQASSSRPDSDTSAKPATAPPSPSARNPAPDAPSAALRDLLAAACAHDEPSFEKFLTARNAQSFAQLAPTARTELMKRFVLLDGAGKPALSSNPSGRPDIRCSTPDGAADIQLGGAELHDNIALVPLDIRDVSELGGGDPHHILMGMVRENSSWKILSLGMLFLDLPSLEVEWDQASIASNERDALNDLKTIARAIENYRRTYSRLPDSFAKMSYASKISADAAGLLDADLVAGKSNGYLFRMVIAGANEIGAPAQYELSATPATYGRTGKLSFWMDQSGAIKQADNGGKPLQPK